jgi:hypothetical protein
MTRAVTNPSPAMPGKPPHWRYRPVAPSAYHGALAHIAHPHLELLLAASGPSHLRHDPARRYRVRRDSPRPSSIAKRRVRIRTSALVAANVVPGSAVPIAALKRC